MSALHMNTPRTEAEVAEVIKSATAKISVQGGSSRGIACPGDMLTTRDLSGISLYEPGSLTLVAAAGTPVADIEAALSQENQRLAFEPMDPRVLLGSKGAPTIGGVMATNASGPRRIQSGAARDFALGVRFVDGTGRVLKNGGRVMKNVTGYDLVKLMCGSYGTLGVMTEVALKVLPMPETQSTLFLHGLDGENAVRAMSAALGSPYEVSGAAHQASTTALRVEGFGASVSYRINALRELLAPFGAQFDVQDAAGSEAYWTSTRDVSAFASRVGDVWRVSCKPSDGPKLAAKAGADDVIYDWGGGLLWLLMSPGTDLRQSLGTFSGHATRVRCGSLCDGIPRFQPENAGLKRIGDKLRAQFDPREILNAGLMGAQG